MCLAFHLITNVIDGVLVFQFITNMMDWVEVRTQSEFFRTQLGNQFLYGPGFAHFSIVMLIQGREFLETVDTESSWKHSVV